MSFGPIAALVISGIGAGVSAIGSIVQGQAGAAAARYQQAVANNNKIIAERNARFELEAGQRAEEAQRMKTGAIIAEQKVAQAANGVDVTSGSALKVRQSAEVLGELDAQTIRNNAIRRSDAYKAEASNFQAQGVLYGMQAKASALEGWIGAAGSIIGGASNISDKWLSYKQVGLIS